MELGSNQIRGLLEWLEIQEFDLEIQTDVYNETT